MLATAVACLIAPSRAEAETPLAQRMPERMLTGVALGEDTTGVVRTEVRAIQDFLDSSDAVVSVADLRARGLLPAPVTAQPASFSPPATIRVWRRAIDGSADSCAGRVDVLDFDDYVKGVLPHEWIPSWHEESLKAGAVAVRTYAAAWVAAGGKYDCADVDDTTSTQVYQESGNPSTDAAVDATSGVFVVEDGEPVFAEYSAENSNPTEFGVSEPHCAGKPRNGHGRGTCQWGTQRWATIEGRSYDWIVTHYYPGATLTNVDSGDQSGELGDASYPGQMVAGGESVVWVDVRNSGDVDWEAGDVTLVTTGPNGRDSAFFDEGSWLSPSIAAQLDEPVSAGSVGRLSWVMSAPTIEQRTDFNEQFLVVGADGQPLAAQSVTLSWSIEVVPESDWEGPDEPPPGGPGIDGSQADLIGGCRAADRGGSTSALLIVLVMAFLIRRRPGR